MSDSPEPDLLHPLRQRYRDDPIFQRLVDNMTIMLEEGIATAPDIEDALRLAVHEAARSVASDRLRAYLEELRGSP